MLNYVINDPAANHVDVLAAISGPVWVEGVNMYDFYHTLTKVTFTFKKVAPVPNEVTNEKIEFQKQKKRNLRHRNLTTTTKTVKRSCLER